MSSIFDKAMDLVFKYEGGYVNDPDDPGGETKYGISKRQYPDLDIKNLTKEQAKEIYMADYWNKIKGNELPPKVAVFLLQCAVNMGTKRAVKILQSSAKSFLEDKPYVDGIIGPQTISCVHMVDENMLVPEIAARQALRYVTLCKKNSTLYKYMLGWLRRVTFSLEYSLCKV